MNLDYYVTLRRLHHDGHKRTAFLAGPFDTHEEALLMVKAAVRAAEETSPRTFWDEHGTASMARSDDNPIGRLNDVLGVKTREMTDAG